MIVFTFCWSMKTANLHFSIRKSKLGVFGKAAFPYGKAGQSNDEVETR